MSTIINDDRILDARDMAEEIAEARELAPVYPRTFEDVINQWTETLLEENKKADIQGVLLILRLGTLGQRLIYEANDIGMKQIMTMTKDVLEIN